MENTNVARKKSWWLRLATILGILILVAVFITIWVQYEKNRCGIDQQKRVDAEKPILHIVKQAKKVTRKPTRNVKRIVPQKQAPTIQTPVVTIVPLIEKAHTPAIQGKEMNPLLSSVDPDFGKTKLVFEPLPEKETAEPKVGRKIYVVRQIVSPHTYGGGYGGYSYGYSQTQVVYGSQYVPPTQPVFIPATPVIVPAPSVVVPAPSVVTPPGGHRPSGSTGGHSPSGTTGNAF